jgi:TfoX/Sxy family transcriptional regulator of competence genes
MTAGAAVDPVRELLERIHTLLPGRQLREVRMFGTTAVMLDDAMLVAVHKDGSLLVRVDPAEDGRLLADAAASRAEMGRGRSMGAGWIRVGDRGVREDASLASWLDAATRHLASRTPGRRSRVRSSASR